MCPTDPASSAAQPGGQAVPRGKPVVLRPPTWPEPKGYAYGIVAAGRTVFLSGVVGWDADHRFAGPDLVSQVRQALTNIVDLLREAGAVPADIVRMTWYLVDKREYLHTQRELGIAYRDIIGRHFPSMTVVQVSDLLEEDARVEIEATAVVPS
jgi:enamine deaminase RidA (YjgF/YER057c/UK114 family)